MKININRMTYDKIMHWINKTNIEVSGFGTVKYNADTHSFDVVDAYLLKQEGAAAHTDIDATSLNRLMYQTRNDEGDLRWWWHSHVQMACFWSGTDTDTIKELGTQGWIVATVFNQKNEMKSAVCYTAKSEFSELIHHDLDIPTNIITPGISPELVAEWDRSFEDNVKEKKYTPYTQTYQGNTFFNQTQEAAEESITRAQSFNSPAWQEESKEMAGIDDDYCDTGLMGYGLAYEANLLGIPLKKYKRTLAFGTPEKVLELENRLMQHLHRSI